MENLKKITLFPQMKYFNDIGVTPNNLLEFAKNLVLAQDKINLSNDIVFFKTHNAMCSVENYPFTNKDNTLGAIYIIRDPRDVLVSYARHDDTSLDFSLKALINTKNLGTLIDDKNKKLLSIIGSWSENYNSWKNFNLTKKKFTNEFELLINNEKRNHEQLFRIKESVKYFENNKSPYDLCVNRIFLKADKLNIDRTAVKSFFIDIASEIILKKET